MEALTIHSGNVRATTSDVTYKARWYGEEAAGLKDHKPVAISKV
jgi:hypothetical protein